MQAIECLADVRLQGCLLSQGIPILTACGGRENGVKCAVKKLKGKTAIDTMDRIWFSEGQLNEGWRLECRVYTKEPTTVEV